MDKHSLRRFPYMIVREWHEKWSETNGLIFNNLIIDYLRNRLLQDIIEWKNIYIDKKTISIPEKLKNVRKIESDISFRKFKFGFMPKPCEICGKNRALTIAHIIPRALGGPDDDWNLLFLCANHHYLFDSGRLTKEEWFSVNWSTKGTEAQYYIEKVRLEQHKIFWKK